jgi:hypothetical protein
MRCRVLHHHFQDFGDSMDREQELIDIIFQIAQVSAQHMHGKTQEEICTWTAKQLRECGYDTEPIGASWGVLKSN